MRPVGPALAPTGRLESRGFWTSRPGIARRQLVTIDRKRWTGGGGPPPSPPLVEPPPTAFLGYRDHPGKQGIRNVLRDAGERAAIAQREDRHEESLGSVQNRPHRARGGRGVGCAMARR